MKTILLQTVVPVYYPVDSGPSGPWTDNDTKVMIAIAIAWLLMTVVSVVMERLVRGTKIMKMVKSPLDAEWFVTAILLLFSYICGFVAVLAGVVWMIWSML